MPFAPFTFDPEILREYDIRGQVGKNLDRDTARYVGLAFGTWLRRKGGGNCIVGFDGRASSSGYAAAATQGLTAAGITVDSIGLGPTPMLYYAVRERKTDGGLMITGSHNPPDYNGFKMMTQGGPFYGAAVQELGAIARTGDFAGGSGRVNEIDIKDAYVDRLLRDYTGTRPLKVAWDCGNGAAGEIVRRLTAKLPGEHILLFDDIDGTFPNHHPDPVVDKNLDDLIRVVREQKCDLGVAFDGDADRIGAVDEKGDILRCDVLLALYAREVLADQPGATIIGDVKSSQVLFDEIKRLGGTPLMWKTGHSLVKAKMYELKAPLAGELSGHIFFGHKFYGHDDGIYCAIRLMNLVAAANGPASGLTAGLPKPLNTPEIRFDVAEKDKFEIVKSIIAAVKAQNNPYVQIDETDGLRVTTPDGWWLLRASNTQAVLTARAESQSIDGLAKLKAMIKQEVEKLGYDAPV